MQQKDRIGYGLIVDVYRNSGMDCSRNGISATHDHLTVVGIIDQCVDHSGVLLPMPEGCLVFAPSDKAPAVWLIRQRMMCGGDDWYLRPAGTWTGAMMGGNFAYSSDSRFAALHGTHGALRIHDRFEN